MLNLFIGFIALLPLIHAVHFNNSDAQAGIKLLEWKVDIGFDLEVTIQSYRFASNEYRLYPMRWQWNFCDGLANNIMGSADLVKCENCTTCPLRKKTVYSAYNWSPNPANFPPLIPDGQYMVELQGLYKSTEMYLQRAYATISRPIPIP